ncbi:Mediator of RNA polymerase II transcription subunit 33A [Senna tora]|uniref:Mediator of RNA polymerase II transcription subunit 33A n=1 Tax=Senna tora TaxID=362788 RepID=A0A834SZS2_9FABA|nr:Mediator of RNA polymerase II transcription subunit 33A [Senna tora]
MEKKMGKPKENKRNLIESKARTRKGGTILNAKAFSRNFHIMGTLFSQQIPCQRITTFLLCRLRQLYDAVPEANSAGNLLHPSPAGASATVNAAGS